MSVRLATSDDIDALSRVARESWGVDYPDLLHRENVDEAVNEWYDQETLTEELARGDSLVYVATENGDVVGFAHAVCRLEQGHILRVYVTPDARGRGHGRALVDRTREELVDRGVDSVRAMVLAANEQGNSFYEALGFEPTEEGGETEIGGDHYEENVYVYGGG